MTIKRKLILSISFLLVLLVGLGALSINSLNLVNKTSTDIASTVIPKLECANSLNYELSRYRTYEYQHIIIDTKDEMKENEQTLEELKVTINENLEKYVGYVSKEEADEVKQQWESYLNSHEALLEASRNLDTKKAMFIIKGDSKIAYDKLADSMEKFESSSDEDANRISKDGDELYKKISIVMNIAVPTAIIIGIIMAIFITLSITKPLKLLKTHLQELVEKGGDLTHGITIKSKDEIGDLANSLNQFIQNIRQIIKEVYQRTNEVETAIDNVSIHIKSLTENVEESSATDRKSVV